jgi:hypothetical protein
MASKQPPDMTVCKCGVLKVDCICNVPTPKIRDLTPDDLVPQVFSSTQTTRHEAGEAK